MDAVTSPTRTLLSPDIWREVAEHLPLLAWIVDADGRLQWANARWRDFAGSDPAEVTERWLPLLLSGEGASVEADLAAALAAGRAWEGRVTLRAPGGDIIRCEARVQPVAAGQDGRRYAIGTANELPEPLPAAGQSEAEQEIGRAHV